MRCAAPVRSFENDAMVVRLSIGGGVGGSVKTSPSAPTATAGPPAVPVTPRRFSASEFGMSLYVPIVPRTTVPKEPDRNDPLRAVRPHAREHLPGQADGHGRHKRRMFAPGWSPSRPPRTRGPRPRPRRCGGWPSFRSSRGLARYRPSGGWSPDRRPPTPRSRSSRSQRSGSSYPRTGRSSRRARSRPAAEGSTSRSRTPARAERRSPRPGPSSSESSPLHCNMGQQVFLAAHSLTHVLPLPDPSQTAGHPGVTAEILKLYCALLP